MTVKQKQNLLAYLGYYTGKIDDLWGDLTETATREFQRASGLVCDGVFGDGTLKAAKEAVANDRFKEHQNVAPETTDTFWDHIRYWTREEFRCRCGGKYCNGFPVEPDQTLVELVDDLRHKAGRPGHRSSGIRCQIWNEKQGGVWNSRHKEGKALDFFIEGVSGAKLLSMAQADPRTRYAYIIDGQYVHVDVK